MKCTNCGTKIAPGYTFCPKCGAPVPAVQTPPYNPDQMLSDSPTSSGSPPPVQNMPGPGRGKKRLAILLTAIGGSLLLIAGIIFTVLYIQNRKLDRELEKYQTYLEEMDTRFANYIMEPDSLDKLQDYKDDLSREIQERDLEGCQDTVLLVDEWEKTVAKDSEEALAQVQAEIGEAKDSVLYEAEYAEVDSARAEGDKLAAEKKYSQAKEKYNVCLDIVEAAKASDSYSMELSQVDVTDFPQVKLYLSVKDLEKDEMVDDLQQGGFILREKLKTTEEYKDLKIEKAVKMDQNEGLNTAIVADVSASMGDGLYTAEDAMAEFVKGMQYNVNDRAALYSFADTVYREHYFTKDEKALTEAIYGMETGNMTALYDALVYSISDIIVENGAKCVIAFTDGQENNSVSTKGYVVSKAKQYDIPIYIIGIGNGVDSYELEDIAEQTGGFYRNIADISSMRDVYSEIYMAQKSMYVLQYTTLEKNKTDLLRELYIRYSDDNYKIRTETSYTPSDYKIDNFIFHDSDSRYLQESELNTLSEEEVLIALNEIYARRGYKFTTNDFLIDHFNKCSWYKGKYTNQNKLYKKFNKYEKANVQMLVAYEKKNKLNNRK